MAVTRYFITAVLMVSLTASTSGCWSIGETAMPDKPYEYDTAVTQRLKEFQRQGPRGTRRRLDQMTTFDWDSVHLFAEGTSYKDIDAAVGTTFFGRDGRYGERGSLLVFTKGKRVVHAVALVPPAPLITGSVLTYPREAAVLEAYTKDPGPYDLTFVESSSK